MKIDRKQRILIVTILTIMLGLVLALLVAPITSIYSQTFVSLGISIILAGITALILDRVSFSILVEEVTDELEFASQDLEVRRSGVSRIEPRLIYESIYKD